MGNHIMFETTETVNITTSSEFALIDEDDGYLGQCLADVLRREQRHENVSDCLVCEQTPDGQKFKIDTEDKRLKELSDNLRAVHEKIMSSDGLPYIETTFRDPNSSLALPAYKLTRLGKKTRTCCLQYLTWTEHNDAKQQYVNHLFNPIITVMLDAMRRWAQDVGYLLDGTQVVLQGSPDSAAARALHRLVKFVRRVCGSRTFKNEWEKYNRQAMANFKSGRDYIIHLFSQHARQLVLRVDLYIRPEARSWGYTREANEAAQTFMRKLRDGRVVPGYLGSIIKRENGISRGIHGHWMVFLDGHEHRNAYGLTQMIGEAWMKHVGFGRGSYFNCYARRHAYQFNGLGLVHTSSTEKLLGIRAALWYMTKRDCVLRTDNDKHQDFRRSKPRRKEDARRGAPRKNPDSLALAKRLLGGERSKYPSGFDL